MNSNCPMRDDDFHALAEVITAECGIKLPSSKKVMLESRVRKRLKDLHLESFEQYRRYFFGLPDREQELPHLIDVVTTNTTDFFREPNHFKLLVERVLPEWHESGQKRELRVWSAGCSSGEEPYTLAMVLMDFAERCQRFFFEILATDISGQVLQKAMRAVYPEDRIRTVPEAMKRKYLLRHKDRTKKVVRVVPELRSTITFKRLNFMDSFRLDEQMDVIFCRNVLIYFDRETQSRILQRICSHLIPDGYLFIGHSESLAGMGLPVVQIAPTVYKKR
jgi:chemotaxis protein methyltransferase CheR